jgi:hypothetical protein
MGFARRFGKDAAAASAGIDRRQGGGVAVRDNPRPSHWRW